MWRCGPTFGDDYVRPRPVLVPRSLPVCPTRYGDDWPVRSDILDIDCALDCASHTGWDLALHFPAPEQRPWLQVSALVVQTESFLHRPREGRTASPKKDRVIPATSLATKPQETNRRMPLRAPRRAPRSR